VKKIELLSPAKSSASGIAAINYGADAVYIGASRFGAREAAGNDIADIGSLVAYAHRFYARVYATVNTLLYDNELDAAEKLIHRLYETGVDAIIIQDMGICEMNLPPIPLFASTQCHNNSVEKIKFLEEAGFSRVILARELTHDAIKNISDQTSIDLEAFVHGSLCVSYSGQCWMSYALGGRSGNRGSCAQPCRKHYRLETPDGKKIVEGHLLSLKDLNLSSQIASLIDAGVSSFKIEGRLKDENYVKNITAYYRKEIDRVLEAKSRQKSSSGRCSVDFDPDPDKTFNRGYSQYFFDGRKGSIAEWRSPKFVGEKAAEVLSVLTDGICSIKTFAEIHPGDGVVWFSTDGQMQGSYVSRSDEGRIRLDKSSGIAKGTVLYRNLDTEFIRALEKSKSYRKVGVTIRSEKIDDHIEFQAEDDDGIKAVFETESFSQKADNPHKIREMIKSQMIKTGNTIFYVRELVVDESIDFFIPVSAINDARRNLLDKLESERVKQFPKNEKEFVPGSNPYPEKILTYKGNVLNDKARAFYTRHGVEKIEPAAESGLDMKQRTLMTTRYCVRHEAGLCVKNKNGNSDLILTDDEGRTFRVSFNCDDCVMEIKL
jgi:23S rRNA 5-hydroxycytidine C2501 synthase